MGAVRMRVQTSDKNISIIHTTPVQQLVLSHRNPPNCFRPSLIVDRASDHLFIYIYAFSRRFYLKRISGYTCFVSMCSLGIEPTTFCAANAMLYHWATGTHTFTYTCIVAGFPLMMDLFLTNTQQFTSQDINCWTGLEWIIVMFLSAVWTLILTAPIHCRGSIAEQVM